MQHIAYDGSKSSERRVSAGDAVLATGGKEQMRGISHH
jgi:hypothetical protein